MVRSACADVLHVLPGMSLTDLGAMDWPTLSRWRETAVKLWKQTHGIKD